MAILEKWERLGARIDSFAGRIAYRFFGLIAGFIGIAAAWASWDLITSGESVMAGIVFGLAGAGCLWLAKWCFSPSRKLSEMDF